jgi:hypothetical protein
MNKARDHLQAVLDPVINFFQQELLLLDPCFEQVLRQFELAPFI